MNKKSLLKLFPVFAFVCASAWVYWKCFYNEPLTGIDDANIYFIYMRHFAEGKSFVFNAGGERVEGFTSLLWTLIGAAFFKITHYPQLCLLFLSLLLVGLAIWQLIVFIDRYFNDNRIISPYALFILGMLLLIPGYYEWTTFSLIETGLWSCLLITTVLNLCYFEFDTSGSIRLNRWFTLLLVLMVLSRPESYLWGLVFLAIRFTQFYRIEKKIKKSFTRIALPASSFIATIIILTAWRLRYFGFPFPNTYYDKISADHIYNLKEGFKYIGNFLLHYKLTIVILLFIILHAVKLLRSSSSPEARIFFILILSLLTTFAIPLYTGGDHFRLARLFQPVVPLLYFAFLIAVRGYYNLVLIKTRNYFEVLLFLFLAMFTPATDYNFINYFYGYIPSIKIEFDLAEKGKNTALQLNAFFKDNKFLPVQGILAAGGLGYYYQGKSIDLVGLNNVAMAHANPVKIGFKNHAAFDKETFYKLKPDIAFTTAFIEDAATFVLEENSPAYDQDDFSLGTIYKNIFKDERFRNMYLPVFIFRKGTKETLHTYANTDFLSRLDSSIYSYTVINR